MTTPEGNQSEVARIRQQIAAEQESAQRALTSPAYGTTQHRFITRRMERQGKLHDRLRELVGDNEADQALIDAMEKGKEGKGEK
jgi:hypothetical protein